MIVAEFQSICTGEYLTVAKKHKTACGIKWKVPGIMGGNAVPGWEDQQGSIIRRIALFDFTRAIETVDTLLPAKLQAEMPSLVLKCNRAYLCAAQEVGSRSIWASGVLPAYFHKTRQDMAQIVNSMKGFLASDAVRFGPHSVVYCPLTEVQSAWTKWIIEQNISPRPRWSQDLYTGPMEAMGLAIVKNVSKVYPRLSHGSRTRGKFVLGVDLASEFGDDGEDEENQDPNRG